MYSLLTHSEFKDQINLGDHRERMLYVSYVGFGVRTVELMVSLAEYLQGKKVLEVASGTGFTARHLENLGVDIHTVDNGSWDRDQPEGYFRDIGHRTVKGDAIEFLEAFSSDYDVILMSWPNYDSSFAYHVVENMVSGQVLLYEGEGEGGCTGDDAFFDVVRSWVYDREASEKINQNNFNFVGIHSRWECLKKP